MLRTHNKPFLSVAAFFVKLQTSFILSTYHYRYVSSLKDVFAVFQIKPSLRQKGQL